MLFMRQWVRGNNNHMFLYVPIYPIKCELKNVKDNYWDVCIKDLNEIEGGHY